jgi:hypothetical protein
LPDSLQEIKKTAITNILPKMHFKGFISSVSSSVFYHLLF